MTDKENKPVLDEQTFERLLEAAYVLQEHNRKIGELELSLESQSEKLQQKLAAQVVQPTISSGTKEHTLSSGDYTLTLAEIVDAQRHIQVHHLGLDQALEVVADRVARITGCSGAAIGILDGATVRYRAGTGTSALSVGSETPLDGAVCQASVRTGKVIRSEDVNTEFLFDPELCRKRGILSLLAVPIYRDGDIVGALELYFDRVHGFAEQDIHTCQLMAGLVTEAIGRDAELSLKRSAAAERATLVAAMEKLRPNLTAVAEQEPLNTIRPGTRADACTVEKPACWKCGNSLLAEEQFCGNCGMVQAGEGEPSSMQRKIASAWQKPGGMKDIPVASPSNGTMNRGTAGWPDTHAPKLQQPDTGEFIGSVSLGEMGDHSPPQAFAGATADHEDTTMEASQNVGLKAPTTALVTPQQDVVWSSAARAREFLESVAGAREPGALGRFWRSRRGDFYLAIALVLVAVVIRWGIWSEHAAVSGGSGNPTMSHRRKYDPKADLSAFDKLLIGLGLAEAPDAPEYKGNPDTQVWVDLHTALYYCPGSDLYGKTPKGKFSIQRDAQLDQFEPAYRKACD